VDLQRQVRRRQPALALCRHHPPVVSHSRVAWRCVVRVCVCACVRVCDT
jgi:hypothetical protein